MGLVETAIGIAVPEAGIPLRVLGGLKSAGSWILGHPFVAGCLALALWGAVERHEAHKWHTTADQRLTALKALPAAQAKALAAQKALDAQVAAKSATDAKDTDNDPQTAIDAAVADYAATHRLQRANCGAASPASAAAQTDAAQVDHGSGALPIVLSDRDFRVYDDAMKRLLKAHVDGDKLIADGVAVAEPFGSK